jgi:hypothetical protein
MRSNTACTTIVLTETLSIMFYIYSRVTDSQKWGRNSYDRYYKNVDNAKHKIDTEAKYFENNGFWKLTKKADYFDSSKGFYVYEYYFTSINSSTNGDTLTLALINGYYQD